MSFEEFDVTIAIPVMITATGANHLGAVATTGGYYIGSIIKASAADCTVTVYNNNNATTGDTIDMVFVDSSTSLVGKSLLRHPVFMSEGITVNISESGAKGTIHFIPKG